MQDFARVSQSDIAKLKATMAEGQQYTLINKRDGKKYWIAKLADDNIWMAQNLDLDLSTSKELTPANTDISAKWTPENSTVTFTGIRVNDWQNKNYDPQSASPEELYFYSSGTSGTDSRYTSLSDCKEAHPDCSMRNYAGNYYNWSAAVGSNDTATITTEYADATDSICPAGWKLPTGRNRNNTAASREWNALLVAQGIMTNPTGEGYATGGLNNIRKSPLWLTRAGGIYMTSFFDSGNLGCYWTSTVIDTGNAYDMNFNNVNVNPASSTDRGLGCSIRCRVK